MDWLWHVIGFLMTWFVLADTFYRGYSKWLSFVGAIGFYPVLAVVSQLIVAG